MVSSPEIMFKSDNLANLPKETLITLLKHDELNMKEIDIWTSIIEWATNQVPGLINEPDSWSSEDFTKVRAIISDYIQHIRFFDISSEDFQEKIYPYDELLTKDLRRDIVFYHMNKNYKPKSIILPPRKSQAIDDKNKTNEEDKTPNINVDIDSVIINEQQASWITQKIMESMKLNTKSQRASGKSSCFYKLTLLYRHSRDGNTYKSFRQMCAKKGPTVAVGKVLNTEEILGGYNPIAWRTLSSFPNLQTITDFNWVQTSESFIFSLNKDSLDESIVSFVVDSQHAVCEHQYIYPCFGGDIDLHFGGLFPNGKSIEPHSRKLSYQIAIRPTTDTTNTHFNFKWLNWEVFSVTKMN